VWSKSIETKPKRNATIIANKTICNMKEEGERKTPNIVYPVRSNNDLLCGDNILHPTNK